TSFADVEADDITRRRSVSRRAKEFINEAVQRTVDAAPAFRSLTVDVLYPIDLARVEDLFNRYRVSVLRAKGFVHSLSVRRIQEIQWVPGSFTVQPYQHDKPVRPHIVMIGRRVPWQRVFEQLDACVLSPTPCPQN
ncbi:MAG TPA: GTP-binding protein, partial [Methylomirabilota bacterium]|nr:GTP-binding protein [Methylomirabilota bacterium]